MLDRIDNWHSDWNFLSATKAQRYVALIMSGIAAFLWAVRGWDSGIGSYGTSLHYSFFVIYFLEYAILNWWMYIAEKIGGIRNLIISVLWMVFSVALFEWYWGISYALFHGEFWVLTTINNIYLELIAFTIIGALGGLYAMRLGVKPIISWITIVLILPCILWLAIGFPQTCYPHADKTVTYVENNWIHLLNVIAKLGMSLAIAKILMRERLHEMRIQFILAIVCSYLENIICRARG